MLRVNKKIEYGILALLHLNEVPNHTASVREIASACHIPEKLLSKIMQTMKSHGFVLAIYGNHGGYRLNRTLAQISLLDVNNSLAGPLQMAECLEPGNQECKVKAACTIATPMNELNKKLIDLFQSTSLETLSTRKVAL